jgi:hypothetical protein
MVKEVEGLQYVSHLLKTFIRICRRNHQTYRAPRNVQVFRLVPQDDTFHRDLFYAWQRRYLN